MTKNRKTYIKPESYAIEMGDVILNNVSIGINTGEVVDKPGSMGAPKYYGIEDDMDDMDDVDDAGFGY